MIRVFLVDNHAVVRAGVRHILEQAGDIAVVGEVADGATALVEVKKVLPDVVLMDISMPGGMGGIEATRRMVRQVPGVKVVALSVIDDEPFPLRLREVGAVGYLTKGCRTDELIDAVRAAACGRACIDSTLACKQILAGWRGAGDTPWSRLSSRELQVALMILEGARTSSIAETLALSPKTVSTYRQRIFEKLGIASDVDLTRLAYRYGLLEDRRE